MKTTQPSKENEFYNSVWLESDWSEMIANSPAPRHRRHIIKDIIKECNFQIDSMLDVGCGSGILINETKQIIGENVRFAGCDISSSIIDINKQKYQDVDWFVSDLDEQELNRQADIVTCSEVLEHVRNWEQALEKLIKAAKKRVIITVPSGKLFEIDRKVGHYRHFDRKMMEDALKKYPGIKYKVFFWGFPFHTLYKYAINLFPEKTYSNFAQSKYSGKQETFSKLLHGLFYLNIKSGFKANQMFVVIDKNE